MFSKTVKLQNLEKKISGLQGKALNHAKISLVKVGNLMINDFVNKPPTPRIFSGNLRGSYFISVGNNIYVNNSKTGANSPVVSSNDTTLRVGFTMPYAEDNETGLIKKKIPMGFGAKSRNASPTTGNFFMKTKITNKKKQYIKLFNDFFKEVLV